MAQTQTQTQNQNQNQNQSQAQAQATLGLDEAPATQTALVERDERALVGGQEYAVLAEGSDGGAGLLAALADNLGGDQLRWTDLTRIKVPAGGATVWEVPTLDGTESTPEIEGVIVHWAMIRSFWASLDPAPGTPPDCSSDDLVHGRGQFGPGSEDNPSGRCDRCPMAQFGSAARGAGQACKSKRLLFILRSQDRLPVVIGAPPGSLKALRQYFLKLASFGRSHYAVVTRLGLEKAQSKAGPDGKGGGITYARIVPAASALLTPEQAAVMAGYKEQLRPVIAGAVYDAEAWEDDAADEE